MQHISTTLPALARPRTRRQRAGWHGRCRRHERIYGPAPGHRLDKNAKARILVAARVYNARYRQPGQHWGPITRACFGVLAALLWGFHHNDKGGVCFPGYSTAAKAARCHRDTFYEAIKTLEEAGLLTWVNRIIRIRVRERDMFGHWATSWRVVRNSNAYQFVDPLDARPSHRHRAKSDFPTGVENQGFKKETRADGLVDNPSEGVSGAPMALPSRVISAPALPSRPAPGAAEPPALLAEGRVRSWERDQAAKPSPSIGSGSNFLD
jgi:hypothetical protein